MEESDDCDSRINLLLSGTFAGTSCDAEALAGLFVIQESNDFATISPRVVLPPSTRSDVCNALLRQLDGLFTSAGLQFLEKNERTESIPRTTCRSPDLRLSEVFECRLVETYPDVELGTALPACSSPILFRADIRFKLYPLP